MSPAATPRRRRSPARDRSELWLFRIAVQTLGRLPRGVPAALGRGLTRLYLRLSASRRRVLLGNLRQAFPEKSSREIARIARDSMGSFGAAVMDFIEISRLDAEAIRSRVRVVGREHYDRARALHRGVLLMSAHIGGWELGALLGGILGEPIVPVIRPLDNPLLERELVRLRTRFGNRLIGKRDAAKDILKTLRADEAVAILIDQNVIAREGVFVPFFGRLAATSPALALFQLKTGAPVVPVFVWPDGRGRYRVELEPAILAEEFQQDGLDRAQAVLRATARYTEVTEAAIRRDPAAWLWMHNRWRTRPEGAA
ncbi:MAG: lysophospholipid acyltransferase family protein [Acidobacteriota bacterium]